MYSAIHSYCTSALDGGEWSAHALASVLPGKNPPVPTEQHAGQEKNILSLLGFEPQIIQPVV